MIAGFVDMRLLEKQKAGIPLTGQEARSMVCGLRKFIVSTEEDVTLEILMLSVVGSLYYEDVWDILISIEGGGDAADSACR